MTLDTATLRVAFAVVALTLFILFYLVTYRRTRSAYSGWWCAAITLFLTGSSAYLLNGTAQQFWANPVGNVLTVLGAACVWAGARTLRAATPKLWQLAAGPAVVAVPSVLDHPATNNWAGGPFFLALMALLIGLSAVELWRLPPDYTWLRRPLAFSAGFVALYYGGRCLAFLADGPQGRIFLAFFGTVPTTLLHMMLLVVVSFSMAALSHEQVTRELRARASLDGLTGLLNRTAFLDLADDELRRLQRTGTPGVLILADLDHFKSINDRHGHAAGDAALQSFAAACTATVRSTDLVGRYGGEEFVLLLPGAEPGQAKDVARQISLSHRRRQPQDGFRMPTASYGIAAIDPGADNLAAVIAAADGALYKAKSQGRDRAVLAS
ncbi:GGDEF domain-containing protein [Arthrobacter sp. I2-34]|uniref:GGDEF domain-containing protein n=1 Tax=Arthrobacter hankyongi TaxID=2904801 RepID=A0ABS9L8C9_9MICC|nr:GGDEF domain-containing protein [Arthrobacter hankyongi]MCG2622895.1 GGDEF domain-containing protein [Arthrobacter hankyongi]